MLKFYILVLTLGSLVVVSHGYIIRTEISTHPDYPGKCFHKESNTAIDVGVSFKLPNTCEKTSCDTDFRFSIYGCGVQFIDDKSCKEIEPDLKAPFPKCCEKYECTNADGQTVRH